MLDIVHEFTTVTLINIKDLYKDERSSLRIRIVKDKSALDALCGIAFRKSISGK